MKIYYYIMTTATNFSHAQIMFYFFLFDQQIVIRNVGYSGHSLQLIPLAVYSPPFARHNTTLIASNI